MSATRPKPRRERLRLEVITRDARLQNRAFGEGTYFDEDYVRELVELLEAGAEFPPVEVVEEVRKGAEPKLWLIDGFSRCEALRRRGSGTVEALVYTGAPRAYSAGAAVAARRSTGVPPDESCVPALRPRLHLHPAAESGEYGGRIARRSRELLRQLPQVWQTGRHPQHGQAMIAHPPVEKEEVVVRGRAPTPEEEFLLDWGKEIRRQTIPKLTDALQRVVTLATALLGGSLFVATANVVPSGARVVAMFLFLISLSLGMWGSMPHSEKLDVADPESVRDFKDKVIAYRERWLWNSYGALWLGLLVASVGSLLRAVNLA